MEKEQLELLRYPVGRFEFPVDPTSGEISSSVAVIASFPERIAQEVAALSDSRLDTPYRPEGWTLRQVVHHVADSHMNAYIRFKWTLTETTPEIKTYKEEQWARLPDVDGTPVELSLSLLRALHRKWELLLISLDPGQWERTLFHPGFNREITLAQLVCQYSWHCRHHLAHITSLKMRMGWD